MSKVEELRNLGRIAGHLYFGLIETKVPPEVAVSILVLWMREIGKESSEKLVADTLKRIEEASS